MTQTVESLLKKLPEGSRFICELAPGTRLAHFHDMVIAVHPEHPPYVITPYGLRPLYPTP